MGYRKPRSFDLKAHTVDGKCDVMMLPKRKISLWICVSVLLSVPARCWHAKNGAIRGVGHLAYPKGYSLLRLRSCLKIKASFRRSEVIKSTLDHFATIFQSFQKCSQDQLSPVSPPAPWLVNHDAFHLKRTLLSKSFGRCLKNIAWRSKSMPAPSTSDSSKFL